MKKSAIFLIVALFFASCGEKEEVEPILSLDDIKKATENQVHEEDVWFVNL